MISSKNNVVIKFPMLVKILVNDTIRVVNSKVKNITAMIRKTTGFTPRMTPALVATAFPPLNFK